MDSKHMITDKTRETQGREVTLLTLFPVHIRCAVVTYYGTYKRISNLINIHRSCHSTNMIKRSFKVYGRFEAKNRLPMRK